jgi:putative transposase
MEVDFCVEALGHALRTGKPEIFNTDQGSQFTSRSFTELLGAEGVMISMDGRGRIYDSIFVERLWRSVTYEEVYLREYETIKGGCFKPQSLLSLLQPEAAAPGSRVQDPIAALYQ